MFVIGAMTPLAILAIVAGWFEHSFVHMVTRLLPPMEAHVDHNTVMILIVVTSGIALAGIAFAVFKHKKSGTYFSETFKNRLCYKMLAYQYFIPGFIDKAILRPYYALSKFSWKEIDVKIVDTIVDAIAKGVYSTGEESRAMQSGNLSDALKWMVAGATVLLVLAVALGSLK